MTITQYNFNNSLTPEFKWALLAKRNNLDELINIPTKAGEGKFCLGPKIRASRQAQSGIHVKIHSWSMIHCVFKIRQSARFTAKIHNLCAF